MSRQVDENVVKMTFDNRDFEKNIKNTTQSLDDFKRKLSFSNESKSFDAINKKAASTDLSPIGKAVESVSSKFSALQVVGVTALANITNSAVNAGKNIANSLTIQPITTGFNEYELKMGSVQTIMASTGESLSVVNKYLDELNAYSDKTIYSFSDMTSNIGKFTNAGVKLNDAVMAIKGISNEAAVSGANAEEASRSMYNFSQALSSGYVKIADWKSIELANMATLEFKNQLLESAVAAGTLTKQADGMYKTIAKGTVLSGTKNFNETLDEQWMTTEVLVSTLKKYSDETTTIGKKAYGAAQEVKTVTQLYGTLKEAVQSGWAETWELIIGDFEHAKNFLTTLSGTLGDIIGASAEARNKFVGDVMSSGYEKLASKISEAGISLEDFEKVLKSTATKEYGYNLDDIIKKYGTLSNAFSKGAIKDDVITRTLDKLINNKAEIKDVTKSVENFEKVVSRVINGDFGNGKARIDALTKAGYDYKTVQDLVNKTLSGVKVNYDKLNETQLKNLGYTDEQIAKLKEIQNELEKTGGISGKMSGRELLTGGIQNIIEGFKNLSSTIKKAFSDVFNVDKEGAAYNLLKIFYDLTDAFKNLSERSSDIKDTFGGLFSVAHIVYTIFKKIYDFVKSKICPLLGVVDIDILSITANIGRFLKYLDKFVSNNLSLKNIGNFWLDFFSKGKSKVGSFAGEISKLGSFVGEISKLDAVSEISSTFNSFSKTAKETISSIDAFSGIGTSIKNLGGSLTPVNKVLTETATISKDSFKETKNLESGMTSLTGTLNTAAETGTSVLETMPNTINSSLEKSSAGIMAFLTTVKNGIKNNSAEIATIVVSICSLKTIRELIPVLDKVATGIVSVTAPLNGIGSVFKEFANNIKAKRYSDVVKDIAISIGILTASIFVLAKIGKDNSIWKALAALAVLSVILAGLSYVMKKTTIPDNKKSIFSPDACKTMIGFSVGIVVLSKAMEKISTIKFVGIIKGLFGIAAAMGIMVAATKLLSTDTEKQISGVFSAITFAGALYMMAKALEKISEFKLPTVMSGLLMIASAMAALILMSKLLTGSKDFMKAFSVLASSSILMFIALKLLEKIKSINTTLIQRAIVSILPIVAAVLVLAKILSGSTVAAGMASIGLAAIGIGISISLLMSTLSKIESIKLSVLASALAVIVVVGVILTAIVSVSSMAKNALKAAVLLISASLAIAAVAGIVVLLTHIKSEGLGPALITLGVIGGIFALVIGISGLCTEAHKTVIAIGAILTILLGIVASLTIMPVENVSGVTKLVASLAIAMGVLMSLSRIVTLKSVALVGLMGLVVSGLVACMALVMNLVPEGAIPKITALEQALLLLAGALGVCIVAGLLAAPAIIGAIAMIAFIAIFGGLMFAIGALSAKFDSIQTFLDKAIPIMASIGEGLGSVVGGFINGIGSEASKCLPTIATNLSEFAGNLNGFIELCAAIGDKDSTIINGVDALTKVMIAFAAGEFIAAIGDILGFGDGYKQLSSKITDISDLLTSFNTAVSGMSEESLIKMNLAAQAATALATFADNIPRKDAKIDKILGVKDMKAFGESIVAFGGAMADFGSKVSTFNPAGTAAVIEVGNSLSSLANTLPNSGGKIAKYFGDNKMDVFSNQLPTFADNMVTFGDKVANFNPTACASVINVATSLSSFADSIPNSGGKIAKYFGDNTIDAFGTQLVGFATSMVTFGDKLADEFNPNSLANVKVVAEILQLLCAKSDYDGGAVSAFNYTIVNTVTYKNDYATFGKMLQDLLKVMADLTPDKALTNLNQLSTGLSTFFNSITPEKSANAKSTVKMMSDVSKLLSSLKKADTESIKTGASDIGKNYISGLKQGFKGIDTSIKSDIDSLKSAMDVSSNAYYIGVNTVKGFANGVNDNIKIAVDSVSDLSEKVIKKLKEVLDIHSPSKVTQQFGKFFGMGFINGIKDSKKSVLDYVGGFGTSIKDKFSSTLKTTSGKFNIEDMAKSMLDVNSLDIGSLTPSLNADAVLNELKTTNESFKGEEKLNQEELEKIQNDKLMAQNDFWSKLLTAKKKGIEADKYQDMSYLDFQKDTLDQVKSIWDEYTSELESKTDSLNSRLDIFAEVAKKTEEQLEADSKINGNSLIGNLKDQIQQYDEYYNIIKSLGMRIKDQDIMDQLYSQGLDSLTQLKAVNSMTDEQLDEFIALNKKKADLAANTAYEQTSSLRQSTENKLSWLLGGIDINASDFAQTFDGSLESLQAYVTQSIGKMQSVGKNLKAGVLQGMTADPQETKAACETVVGDVETGLRYAADIHSPSQRMADQVGTYLTSGIGYGMQDSAAMKSISDATKFVIDSLVSNFMSYKKTFESIGEYIITSMFASKNVIQEAINAVNLCLTTPDSRPVIKPILDLSDVNKGFKGMSNMTSTVVARGISANISERNSKPQNGQNHSSGNTVNYNFNQTNNSPKALNAAEIYQQTKKSMQLARIGG